MESSSSKRGPIDASLEFRAEAPGDDRAPRILEQATGHRNMLQLIQLRWIAVVAQVATLLVVTQWYDIPLPLPQMIEVLVCLVAFNVASLLRWRERRQVSQGELFLALLVDLLALTVQLHFSGGASNPFVFLFLLQVILCAILLEPRRTWWMLGITFTALSGLVLWSRPLALPLDFHQGLGSTYVQGMLLCFAIDAALLVTFITRIQRNLQVRDARLLELRQRAAEQGQIVRMGLLASGAAHELGTPLATLAVILGDWRRMPVFTRNPELFEEVLEMENQVRRCKAIVSGILLSAGEARGESARQTTLLAFLDGVVEEWRATRPGAPLEYRREIGEDLRVVADAALQQMISNVLDNAFEASPGCLSLVVERRGPELELTVADAGPGFPPDILEHLGTPYQSSKGRAGGGLGLFLVLNVARTLGGSFRARNLGGAGAEVRLTLPLSAIAYQPAGVDER